MTNQEKAVIALQARDSGNEKWFFLVLALSVHLRMSPQEVEAKIEKLARGEE